MPFHREICFLFTHPYPKNNAIFWSVHYGLLKYLVLRKCTHCGNSVVLDKWHTTHFGIRTSKKLWKSHCSFNFVFSKAQNTYIKASCGFPTENPWWWQHLGLRVIQSDWDTGEFTNLVKLISKGILRSFKHHHRPLLLGRFTTCDLIRLRNRWVKLELVIYMTRSRLNAPNWSEGKAQREPFLGKVWEWPCVKNKICIEKPDNN